MPRLSKERYRPRLLIVEATVVNSGEEYWQSWEPILIDANYHKVGSTAPHLSNRKALLNQGCAKVIC
jgi:hypothetical protein